MHYSALAQVQVLLVGDDRKAEHPRVLEGPPHQCAVHDRPAIVRDGHDPRFVHFPELSEALARQTDRNRTNRKDIRQPGQCSFVDDVFRYGTVVVHRIRVRHARHRRNATCHRRHATGRDGLLVFVARLPQVNVHVDESRGDDLTGRVDYLAAFAWNRARPVHGCNPAIGDQYVRSLVARVGRVYDRTAADQNAPSCWTPLRHRPSPTLRSSGRAASGSSALPRIPSAPGTINW